VTATANQWEKTKFEMKQSTTGKGNDKTSASRSSSTEEVSALENTAAMRQQTIYLKKETINQR